MVRLKAFFILVLLAFNLLEARTWTDYRGREFDAELLKVKDGYASFRKLDNSRSIFPISELSVEDQKYIASLDNPSPSTPKGPTSAASAQRTTKLTAWLEKNLVALDGKRLRTAKQTSIPQADYITFYYSASWCPPCRKFTPKLVNFYKKHQPKHSNFEIVFVSSDRDQRSQEKYMADYKMPWPAVKFDQSKQNIVSRYSGRGIPCLVILDRNGKVIEHSYVNGNYVGPVSVMNKLERLIRD